MRRALNSSEIELLEKHPQACRLYLVVDKPTVLLSAQVNMPISTGQTIVNFSNEEPDPTTLYRTWERLSSGNTVKVGTTRGAQNVGTVTLSSAGPSQIVVASNSIAWANGQYLSVGTSWYARVSALGKDVNGNFNGGAMYIPYDNASGDYTKVKPGMTLYLGSTAGGRDLGRARIKSITSTLITVAMNSDVQWADDAYITIVEAIDLWSIYPRINPYTGKWYKDEVAYSSSVYEKQTVWLPPVPIMGPPGVAFLNESNEATLKFIGSESYTLCSNGIKLSATQSVGDVSCVIGTGWNFADGTVVSGSANQLGTEASPNVVKWTSAGRRLVSLNVKNDKPSGYEKSTTGYRPVFILNRPGTAGGINEPYVNFNIETLEGDFDSGGWTATVRVFGDADIEEFPDNAMIVIFAEEWWGGGPYGQTPQAATQQSIGGYPGRENVKLVAWIMEETTHVGFAADGERYVEFRVQTIDGLLKSIAGYIMSMEDRIHSYGTDASTSCTEWWHVFKLQVNRAIQYVTAFHTTLHNMCDVYIANDNSRVWAWDFGDGSLYRQIDDYAASAIAARLLCSKQSQLFIERDIQTAPAGWQPNYVVMALDKDTHLREKLELPRPHRGRVRRVDLEGLIWNGSVATPIIARAPTVAPNQDGVDESLSGYVAESRSEFEEIAGYMLAARNNPWTGLPFRFQGNFSFLDIAPQGWLTLSLAATDNKRGIAWTNKKLVPRRVTMNYDARSQTLLVDAVMDAEAGGSPGITGGYAPPAPVEYDIPSVPISVPGWNNVAYAGTVDGVYKVLSGVNDWYPITSKNVPFNEGELDVNLLAIDPAYQSDGVNIGLIVASNQGLFRGFLNSDGYTWSRWHPHSGYADIFNMNLFDDDSMEYGAFPPNSWGDNSQQFNDAVRHNLSITCLDADIVNPGVYYFGVKVTGLGPGCRAWLLKAMDIPTIMTIWDSGGDTWYLINDYLGGGGLTRGCGGQTFTISGSQDRLLSTISLYLKRDSGSANQHMTISLWTATIDGGPQSRVVNLATIAHNDLSTTGEWVTIEITPSIQTILAAGQVFAIMCECFDYDISAGQSMYWYADSTGGYAYGDVWYGVGALIRKVGEDFYLKLGILQSYTWMPLSLNYPTLDDSHVFCPYNLKVDTQDASRIYLAGEGPVSTPPQTWPGAFMVIPSSMDSVTRTKTYSSGVFQAKSDLKVAVPYYRSGGSRNGNHVIFYGGQVTIDGTECDAIYSTNAGATLSALNTGTHDGAADPVIALFCDSINESAYQVFIQSGYMMSFTSWGNNWNSAAKIYLPGAITNGGVAQHVRKSNIILAAFDKVKISINSGILWGNFSRGLPEPISEMLRCLAVDWGK